jgi:dipeptidyl aminopeptidase/acylaminoacyl peptidase
MAIHALNARSRRAPGSALARAGLVLVAVVGLAGAAVRPDRLLFDSDRSGSYEIYSMALDGTDVQRLTTAPASDSFWARATRDGSRILFQRTPKGVNDTDYTQASLWVMAGDGSGAHVIRPVGSDGWTLQGHAEWSPDGSHIATLGTAAGVLQVFIVDADGSHPRQLTSGPSHKLDCSWSPDGATIVFITTPTAGAPASAQEVWTIPAAGGTAVRLTTDSLEDYDPYYSPDGTRIAWLTQTAPDHYGPGLGVWNIRLMNADGSGVAMVTNDLHINSKPQWSADGAAIYFHRFVYGGPGSWHLYRVAPGGGALTQVDTGAPGNSQFPCFVHYPPSVALVSPSGGTVAGSVVVTIDAGSAAAPTSVQLLVDGVAVGAPLASPPYAFTWDTATGPDGPHVLSARALDAVGAAATSSPHAVTVANAPGGGGSPGGGGGSSGGGCGAGGGLATLLLVLALAWRVPAGGCRRTPR